MIKRAFQLTCLMYYVLAPQQLKADAYCDDYRDGCYAGLAAGGCNDVYVWTCSSSNHDNKSCTCGGS